jgi:hypothetical protein
MHAMAIQPYCDACSIELNEFGGILLSPPDDPGRVKKFHLCQNCYRAIAQVMKSLSAGNTD